LTPSLNDTVIVYAPLECAVVGDIVNVFELRVTNEAAGLATKVKVTVSALGSL